VDPDRADVCIAGGGPAGVAAALALRRRGSTAVLVEATRYDRWRPGESLAPAVSQLLDRLDVTTDFAALAPVMSPAIQSAWGDGVARERHHFWNPHGPGWHVDRAGFDAMLAGIAERRGVRVIRGARVVAIEGAAGDWRLSLSEGSSVRASYVIDATGRTAGIARRLGAKRLRYDRLVALVGLLSPASQATDDRLFVEAVEIGWWYSLRLPSGHLLAALMTDLDLLPPDQRGKRRFWERACMGTEHTRGRCADRRLECLRFQDASTARLDHPCGPGWAAIGDAASSRDPLAADGVVRALSDGLAVAAIHGRDDALGQHAARAERGFACYLRERAGHYHAEQRWPSALFWLRRSRRDAVRVPLTLAPTTTLIRAAHDASATPWLESAFPIGEPSGWLGLCAHPCKAHELVARIQSTSPVPYDDRTIITTLQSMLEAGLLKPVD
jgi:flavin-dependent dehydrogenase